MSNNDRKTVNVNGTTQSIKIKTEPGLSSPTRLSSFKAPRDLTLGGSKSVAKKVFLPNLNAVRNKGKIVTSSEATNERRRDVRGGVTGGRGRGAGAGRGSNILRAGGVFSEGVAAGVRHSSSRGYSGGGRESGGGEGAAALAKPTLKVKNEWKVDKEIEEQQIKELMNDDDEIDTLMDTVLPPTRLPINNICALSATKPRIMTHVYPPIKQEMGVKTEPIDDIQMKEEELTDTKRDTKIKLEYGYSKATTNLLQSEKPTLLLLQFPDSLPGRGPDDEPADKEKKADNTEPTQKPSHNVCTARHLEEGQIGKIVMYKSGKIKLLIGNTHYDLALGTQACFRQDVMSVSVNPEERSGTMINLGCVQSKLTATPDWERMFRQMEAK